MFDLKNIQKTLTTISIVVFLLSLITILYISLTNPNGLLAEKPITALTTNEVLQYGYGQTIKLTEDVKIKDNKSTIVANSLEANFITDSSLAINGLIYLKTLDVSEIQLASNVSIEVTSGEYFINTNPIKIHTLSGNVTYNGEKLTNVNQTAVWQVDRFKISTLSTDDFVLNKSYSDLFRLLKDINLLPSALTNVSLDLNNIGNVIQVSDEEEIDTTCGSDLIVQNLLCDINRFRVQQNLNTLEVDSILNELTLSHANWMNNNQSTSTIESDGLSYLERCINNGFECNAEININIENMDTTQIYNILIKNKYISDKNSSLIGVNIAGNYLSLLLR